MKKIIITMIAIVSIVFVAIYAQTNRKITIDNEEIVKLETLAEQGDTAAMHRLIAFYDENSTIYVEVEAVIEPDGTELTAAEIDSINLANKNNADMKNCIPIDWIIGLKKELQ